jgi:hypothetical protein
MHDTAVKDKAKPLKQWSLDELLGEHDRLQKRYESCPIQSADIRDVFWMIAVACVLEEKGIILNKYYEPIEK